MHIHVHARKNENERRSTEKSMRARKREKRFFLQSRTVQSESRISKSKQKIRRQKLYGKKDWNETKGKRKSRQKKTRVIVKVKLFAVHSFFHIYSLESFFSPFSLSFSRSLSVLSLASRTFSRDIILCRSWKHIFPIRSTGGTYVIFVSYIGSQI